MIASRCDGTDQPNRGSLRLPLLPAGPRQKNDAPDASWDRHWSLAFLVAWCRSTGAAASRSVAASVAGRYTHLDRSPRPHPPQAADETTGKPAGTVCEGERLHEQVAHFKNFHRWFDFRGFNGLRLASPSKMRRSHNQVWRLPPIEGQGSGDAAHQVSSWMSSANAISAMRRAVRAMVYILAPDHSAGVPHHS